MFSARTLLSTGLAIAMCAAYFACAEGTGVEDPATASGAGGGVGGGAGGGGQGGDDDRPSSAKSSAVHTSAAPSSSASGDGGAGEGGGAGGGDEGGASSTGSTSVTSSSSGAVCDFTSPNQCANAESLGSIAGDEDGAPLILTGTTSKWYKVKVEERSSSISEEDLSWRATLESPAGMNYDLVVHEGPQDGDVDCNGVVFNGALSGASESCSNGWDDDQGIGGEDDSVWLAIEVRYVSGEACGVLDTWRLTVEGHI